MKKIFTLAATIFVLMSANLFAQTECFPKAGMTDPEIENAILDAFKAKGWPEKPEKVIILSRDWRVVRNQNSGVIIARELDAVVVSRKKSLIGGIKCKSQDFSFRADYNGNGYSKSMYLDGIGGNINYIQCDCLK